MTIEEAQQEAERRWGKHGFAWIDGSMRHEVGFFDGEPPYCGIIALGREGSFEESFRESDSDEAKRSIDLFFPRVM